jgi:hypothetical protein
MAWISKFSGIPSLDDLTPPGVGGNSTIARPGNIQFNIVPAPNIGDHNLGKIAADLANPQLGNIGYETLAGIGADSSKVLRVTSRIVLYSVNDVLNLQTGVILYNTRADCYLVQIRTIAQNFIGSQGDYNGERGAGGAYTRTPVLGAWAGAPGVANPTIGLGGPSDPGPVLFRMYYNPTGSAFVIPDVGFGGYSVPATTVSYWLSTNDGTTWSQFGDLGATAAIPIRVGLFMGVEASTLPQLSEYSLLSVDEFAPPAPSISTADIDDVFVVSKDVIKINFTQDIAVDGNFLNTSVYQITPSGSVVVEEVFEPEDLFTDFVLLRVLGLEVNQDYSLDLAAGSLKDVDGLDIDDLTATWTHKKTKVDSALDSLPLMYGKKKSNIRTILEAIAISDEEIGGDF